VSPEILSFAAGSTPKRWPESQAGGSGVSPEILSFAAGRSPKRWPESQAGGSGVSPEILSFAAGRSPKRWPTKALGKGKKKMLELFPFIAFITVVLFVWALSAPSNQTMEGRLKKHGYLSTSRQVANLSKPFSQRVALPLAEKAGEVLARITPERLQRRTKEKLELAQLRISPSLFLLATVGLGVILPLLVLSPALREGRFGIREFFLGLAILFLGMRMPGFWLSRKITARQHKVRKSLPDALDLITICVEAGYGLDAALAKVAEKTKGPLAAELAHALLQINLGKPRSQALREVAQRTKVAELQSFIATIIQAEQMGVSIATILRVQSDSMRVKKRQMAEEEAMKAPIKMLFPLVVCILPAMFVVVLGPAAMRMLSFFMGNPGS